jgi:hypothetical protein
VRGAAKRLSYANVAATLALILSMSGGALAARHYLIDSRSQINPRVLRSLRGPSGATGATGPEGPRGVAGPHGDDGRPGRDGRDAKPATIAPVAWTPLTLEHGWEVGDTTEGIPEFTKDAQGFVHLKGTISGELSKSMQFAVLPEGFRPPTEAILTRATGTNVRAEEALIDIGIDGGGAMFAEPGAGNNEHLVSLEGVTFYAG